ncbi:MAG: GGDEF domain-containing protein [Nodosilinea sp.]
MGKIVQNYAYSSGSKSWLTQSIGLTALGLLIPFSINHFIQGRLLVGAALLAVVAILMFNAWSVKQGRYYPLLTLFGLVPAILFFLYSSIHQQGIVGCLWCYPAILSFYFMLPERKAWIANGLLLAIAFSQSWLTLELYLVTRVFATLFAVSIFSVIIVRIIAEQQAELEQLALFDTLTGLFNRASLQDTLEQAIHQNSRMGIPMTLITLDLDYFKKINDTLGHGTGDEVLRGVGAFMKKRIRRTDKVFRTGGEEFLILLAGSDAQNAASVAEQLRDGIEKLELIPGQSVTASLGVATLSANESLTEWMKRSDDNLYRAKSGGRNRVVA